MTAVFNLGLIYLLQKSPQTRPQKIAFQNIRKDYHTNIFDVIVNFAFYQMSTIFNLKNRG